MWTTSMSLDEGSGCSQLAWSLSQMTSLRGRARKDSRTANLGGWQWGRADPPFREGAWGRPGPWGACAAALGKGGSVFAGDTERTSVRVCPHGLARGQTRLSSSSVTAAYPSTPGQTGALSRRTRVLREHLESVQHLSPILVGTEQLHARAHPAGGRLALAPRGSDLVSAFAWAPLP